VEYCKEKHRCEHTGCESQATTMILTPNNKFYLCQKHLSRAFLALKGLPFEVVIKKREDVSKDMAYMELEFPDEVLEEEGD